jgi:hypothetical protein
MNNGSRKGGTLQTLNTLHTLSGLEDVWQLHWGQYGGLEYNVPGQFVANMEAPATAADGVLHPLTPAPLEGSAPTAPAGDPARFIRPTGHTPAWWIKVTAHSGSTLTVLNPRNNFSKTYYDGHWQQ